MSVGYSPARHRLNNKSIKPWFSFEASLSLPVNVETHTQRNVFICAHSTDKALVLVLRYFKLNWIIHFKYVVILLLVCVERRRRRRWMCWGSFPPMCQSAIRSALVQLRGNRDVHLFHFSSTMSLCLSFQVESDVCNKSVKTWNMFLRSHRAPQSTN